MKALIYKEFKLAMHPICYIFMCLFPLLVLVPNYPLAIGFIYVITTYPILFLGANKGQQSNDLLFSTLLPIRKKDIVLARMITIMIIQGVFCLLMAAFSPLGKMFSDSIMQQAIANGQPFEASPGLNYNGIISVFAFGFIGFSIADFIYFPIYYKKGKSIVASTLLTIISFAIYISIFTIVLPYVLPGYMELFCESGYLPQIIFLLISLIIYAIIHYFTYKISAKRLEQVDF